MLISIQEFIATKYPEVKIVSAQEVIPTIREIDPKISHLKFYDITFEYKGKKFSKLFHDRQKETLEEQFHEAVKRSDVFLT